MPISTSNIVEYSLFSESMGRIVIPEPINFEDGNGNIYERDKDSKGFLKTKSNELEYYAEGKDFLVTQYALKGIAEDVLQKKRVKSDDRVDERWKTVSENYLDLGTATFDDERRTAKLKSTQGGLYNLLDSAKDDEFDLVSTTSKTGVDIGGLKTVNITLEPREIFLRSVGEIEDGRQITAVVSGGDRLNARSLPFQFDPNSDQENLQNVLSDKLSAASNEYANLSFDKTSNVFLSNADRNKILTINGTVRAEIIVRNSGTCAMDIVIYDGGTDFNYHRKIQLDTCNPNIIGEFVEFTFDDYELEVKQGESIAIGLLSDTSDGIRYLVSGSITIEEDSVSPASNCRAITEFDLCERIISKITGNKNCLKSELLSNSQRLITQGFWIRNFPDVVQEGTDEERKIQFKTSLKDFLDHIDTTHEPIAWWTERIGNKEVLRIESLKYTQQNFVGIKYQIDKEYVQASDIKRTNLKDNFYSKIIIGSEEGGEGYEEVFGLQSVCGKAEFSTINTNNDSVYEKISPYALGDVDVEIPRRKPFSLFPEEDTKYDSIINVLDCIKVGNNYRLKKHQDIYETPPKNIYRVESAYNLDLTPLRLLLKHGFNINVGLYHYPQEQIIFSSSNCNSSFTSKKVGEVELREDGNIPHALLESPRVRPRSVDFTLQVDLDLEETITGAFNGTPNWFGLVAVKTNKGIEYMRLVKVDTNKEGKHKLVEAFIS